MDWLILLAFSGFVIIIVSIVFVKEVKMGHVILLVIWGFITIITFNVFLIFKFGLLGTVTLIIQHIWGFVVVIFILHMLSLFIDIVNYFYKKTIKIINFVKKLLTINKK